MLKWVLALESGEYEQGAGALCVITPDGDEYCCLGVAVEVAIADGVPLEAVRGSAVVGYREAGTQNVVETSHLPLLAMEWLGVDRSSVQIGHKGCTDPCHHSNCMPLVATEANDAMLKTFPEIAAMIREHYQL